MKLLFKLIFLTIISVNIGFSQTSLIKLTAKKKYSTVSYIDGDTTLSIPVDFKIPNELNVTQGEAGSHKAKFSYRRPNGEIVELIYKGDDDDEHKNHSSIVNKSNYVFESSSKYGIKPGVHVTANRMGLHIIDGEKHAGTTVVVLSIESTNQFGVQKCPNGTVRLYFYSDVPITNVTWKTASTSYSSVSYYAGAPSFSYRSEIYLPFYNGPYSIVANLSDGSSATKSPVTETTSTAPIVNAGPDQSANVCTSNYSFNLAGSVTGLSTTGSWSTSGSGSFSNLNAPNAVYTFSPVDISNGSVILTLTSIGHACNNSDQVVLSVPRPAIVNAGPDQHLCNATSVLLTRIIGGGATGALWSGGSGTFSNVSILNPIYTPTFTELASGSVTLTLTATGSPCGNVSDQVVLNFSQLSYTINQPSPIYCGSTVTLSANSSNAAAVFTWTPQGGGTSLTGNPVTTSLTTTKTYNVFGKLSNSCSVSQTVTAQILTTPSILVSGSSTVTCGSIYSLAINGSIPASPPNTFEWLLGNTVVGTGNSYSTTAGSNILTTQTLNYTLRLNGNISCLSNNVSVTINPCPTNCSNSRLTPEWSTYFGGKGDDIILSMAFTPAGNILLYGNTNGVTPTLPVTASTPAPKFIGTFGTNISGSTNGDLFLAEITPDGKNVNWITYIGGTGQDDAGYLSIDANGDIYISANSQSLDFPSAIGTAPNPNENGIVYVKLTPDGQNVVWSRYYGSDYARLEGSDLIPIGVTNEALIIGGSVKLGGFVPLSINSYKGTGYSNMFIAKINKQTGDTYWSLYFGACTCPAGVGGRSVTHDMQGNIYSSAVANCMMETTDPDYVNKVNSGTTYMGGQDALIAKFNGATGSNIWWDMWGNVNNDFYSGITISGNDLLLTGSYNWIVIANSIAPSDIILERRDKTSGFMSNRRILSGSSGEYGRDIHADGAGNVYVCGEVSSTDLITNNSGTSTYRSTLTSNFGKTDMFIGRYKGAGFTSDWQTYYGSDPLNTDSSGNESAYTLLFDGTGAVYVAGNTNSDNFEWVSSPIQIPSRRKTGYGLPPDGAIVKFSCNSTNTCPLCRTGGSMDIQQSNTNNIDNSILVYPNPSTDEFTVVVNGISNGSLSIEITDAKGVLIESKSSLTFNNEIKVGKSLGYGIYFLKVITANEIKTYKLIKSE